MSRQKGKQREHKSRGFSGAGLGDPHEILPLQNHRNGGGLDGGGFRVASFLNRLEDGAS
jgi:hypothetical protein